MSSLGVKESTFPVAATLNASDLIPFLQFQGGNSFLNRNLPPVVLTGFVVPHYVYLSQHLVVSPDFSNSLSATDVSANFQSLINSNPFNTVYVVDAVFMCGNILPKNGNTFLGFGGSFGTNGSSVPSSGLIQAPGKQFVIGNVPVSSYNNGTPATDWNLASMQQDVTIEGICFNGNRGSGGTGTVANGGADPRRPYINGVIPNYPGLNFQAQFATPIAFLGARNVKVKNCWFYDPCSWCFYTIYVDGVECTGCTILDPVIYGGTTVLGRNTSLFQANGLCRNVVVKAGAGWSNDDFVAINADDPGQFDAATRGGYGYPGAITSVQIEDLRPSQCYHIVRTLTGSPNVAVGSGTFASLIDDVTCRDIKGKFYGEHAYDGGQFYNVAGNHGDVELDNWQITPTGAGGFADFSNVFKSLKFNKFKCIGGSPGQLFQDNSSTGANATIQSFRASGIEVDDATGTVSWNGLYLPSGSKMTIVDAIISGSRFRRYGAASQNGAALVQVNGGAITNLGIIDTTLDNWEWAIIWATGGTMSAIDVSRLTHRNAGAGVSIAIDGSRTLARLVTGPMNTAKRLTLTNGATVTDNKTDGTEDS